MWRKIKAFWNRLPDPLKSGFRTLLWTFMATFGLQLVGWLQSVQEWMTNGGDVPSISVLGKAIAGLIVGLVSGAISLLVNAVQTKSGLGRPARYMPKVDA